MRSPASPTRSAPLARPAALTEAPAGAAPAAGADLTGLTRDELAAELVAVGVPSAEARMRAGQLWHWLYFHGLTDFAGMSTIAKPLRQQLAERLHIGRPRILRRQLSADGTRKWLLAFADGNLAETVYIPEEDRGTLCVSSQVGCTLTCKFCHTGTQKLVRNLIAAEILGQFLVARDELGEWPTPTGERRLISNIVMMGMGEPLYNFEAVAKALRIVMDERGIALSRRRITLSTSGVVPMIERCGSELGVQLAISLHAVRDEVRDELVPLNRKYPIAELLAACRRYPRASNARRITFEYVMLQGVNDSEADARELVRLIRGIPAKVNLIPFNPWPGAPYRCSGPTAIERFAAIVNRAGYSSPVRTPRGRDIMAACGQLKSDSERQRRRQTAPAPA
ncbi:MAG: 23S rRNA (adenine(2503)-C(2))-methyltransferase RlmN [Alphaproteobacteria bacterium]|nr:23S rRNA (adenine(2503)-C(2))-methyltransferase RlmN [Alphaproteobacteria bacterium]